MADACSTHSPSQQPCHSPSERRRRVRLCRPEQPLLCAPAREAGEAASSWLNSAHLRSAAGVVATALAKNTVSSSCGAAPCPSSSPHVGHGLLVQSSQECWLASHVPRRRFWPPELDEDRCSPPMRAPLFLWHFTQLSMMCSLF